MITLRKALLLLVATNVAWGAPSVQQPKPDTVIVIDTLASITAEDPVAKYGISPTGMLDLKKSRADLVLKEFGPKEADSISVTIIGAINQPGHYFLKNNASLADLISTAGNQTRLSTSKLILRRGDMIFRIRVGHAHTVAPEAKDIFPLFLLKEGDTVWISEVTPY